MFKATINLVVRKMPTGKMSLDELKEFFDRQDKYKVADYCTYIKNCLSYRGRRSLKYYFTNENGHNKLIIEFKK